MKRSDEDIKTDLDLSFFDRKKRRSSDDSNISRTAGRRSRAKGSSGHGRLFAVCAAVIVLVLAAVLAFMLKGGDGGATDEADAAAASVTAEVSADASEETETSEDASVLRSCDIPEISMLIDSYFSFRHSADVEGLYQLFGKSEDAYMEDLREQLTAQASWIQGFGGIEIWLANGLDADSKICFVTYDINFRRTDTDAPGIMYCYVEKSDGGSYIIDEQLESDKVELIDSLLSEPEVDELITEVDNELSNVLGYDSDLALIYTAFTNGDIYDESNFDPDREPEVNLFTDPMDSVLIETEEVTG